MHAATDCHPLGARQRAARATARWGVLLGAGALTLSGCGLFSSGEDTTGSSSAAPSSVTPSSVTPSSVAPSGVSSSTGTPSASPSDGPTPSDLGDPFTTLSGFVDDKSVALEVFPVKRSGELAVLQLRMTVDPAAKDRAQIAQTFDDGNFKTGAEGLDSMDGVELVDGARGKVYLAATDTGRRCLCSQNLGATIVDPGQSVSLDVTFAAPPAAASSVDVRIPAFGTVSSVPVQ